MKEKPNVWLPVVLIVVFAVTRLPGLLPLNFSAAYALVFCAAVYLPPRLAWCVPLGVMLATDVLLNLLYYHTDAVNAYMLINYVTYGIIIWLGQKFTARSSWIKLLGGGVLGAMLFYLVTNTAAWLQNPEYAKTLAGWIQALTIGTPNHPPTWEFFRNTLLSGGLFTGLFAGAMKFSENLESAAEKEAPKSEPADGTEDPAEPSTEESKA